MKWPDVEETFDNKGETVSRHEPRQAILSDYGHILSEW